MKDYLEFFGLRDDPFKITPDANYFFLSESHQEALQSLRYLLDTEEGFAVIIGEPGTGKTLTIRKFVDELPESVKYAYILFPNLSPEELFETILEDFGIKSTGETKNRLFARLRDYLIENRKQGNKVLIIIDEAQNLPSETLEELRILSNLETSDQKLLQIILLGQPELEEKLNSKELRQLKQRITVSVKLRNFNEEETKAYVEYRIVKAGRGNVRIGAKSYSLLYQYSLGIPRLINIIMERALMSAFLDTSHEIKPTHIERAGESVGIRVSRKGVSKSVVITAFGGFLIGGAMFLGFHLFVERLNTYTTENISRAVILARQSPGRVYVKVPMLNMREEPTPDSEVIYVLREGDTLEVVDKGPETWLKVRLPREGIEGWVNGKYVGRESVPTGH